MKKCQFVVSYGGCKHRVRKVYDLWWYSHLIGSRGGGWLVVGQLNVIMLLVGFSLLYKDSGFMMEVGKLKCLGW